ncbi:MAG TPA: hypothetical protein VG407_11215 [Caulobacteraceae bacterium]|jgi:hypothetical protein|nr:hypothetical protein [Caulobacteraceae bacterium]
MPGEIEPEQSSRVAVVEDPSREARRVQLTKTLASIQNQALETLESFSPRERQAAAHLRSVCSVLKGYNLEASFSTGDAAFQIDDQQRLIAVSAPALLATQEAARRLVSEGTSNDSSATAAAGEREALSMFLFHEATHVAQRIRAFSAVGHIKSALGLDTLSQIDLVADLRAAHCCSSLQLGSQNVDASAYLSTFSARVRLACELLVRAFPIRGREHKKRRALSLLYTHVVAERALSSGSVLSASLLSEVFEPVYVSVNPTDGALVGVSNDQSLVLLVTDRTKECTSLWDTIGTVRTDESAAILKEIVASLD